MAHVAHALFKNIKSGLCVQGKNSLLYFICFHFSFHFFIMRVLPKPTIFSILNLYVGAEGYFFQFIDLDAELDYRVQEW